MSSHEYIEQLKKMIRAKVDELSEANSFNITQSFSGIFEEIRKSVPMVAKIFGLPEVDRFTLDSYLETARKEFLSNYVSNMKPSIVLDSRGEDETWLTAERREITRWNYTDRYFKHLEKSGRARGVLDEIDRTSTEIVGKLGDPSSQESFFVKGLVVGEVQSGKTGNFNAVINRAIDSGYELIIILSGIMDDLRQQTQERIEADVIGEGMLSESNKIGTKGVGKIVRFGPLGNKDVDQVISVTSVKSDFNKDLADAEFSLNQKNILICKKNVGVLKNLIVWLAQRLEKDSERHNISFLIVDDEADNASLNNEGAKGRKYASRVNLLIRTLLDLFNKKSYLGYTATPFANVLQDRNEANPERETLIYRDGAEYKQLKRSQVDNIFPDQFICLLDSPNNYIGAKQLFETVEALDNEAEGEKIPLIEPVSDYVEEFPSRVTDEEKPIGVHHYANKAEWDMKNGVSGDEFFTSYTEYRQGSRASAAIDNFPKKLPDSLEEAVLCFIISIAIREYRKPEMLNSVNFQPHHTMLVHVSRFTIWQIRTADLIARFVEDVKLRVEHESPNKPNSIYERLESVWYKYYATIVESIRRYLPKDYSDEFLKPMTFQSILQYLPESVSSIETKAINSVTKQSLTYKRESPKKYIAIGGNRLSRGFTLEGLTINYFVRNTNYSDTLLQMGRWFGYRPGYIDCCRLFTTNDSIDKFNQTTKCIEELEQEFKKMARTPNASPENFVLRVKKHPSALRVTRPTILRGTSEVIWSYQDQLEMTTLFDVSREKIEAVWDSFKSSIAPRLKKSNDHDDFYTFETDGKDIINILSQTNNIPDNDKEWYIRFIELCNNKGLLNNWTIALKTTGNAKNLDNASKRVLSNNFSNLSKDIHLSIRRGPTSNQYIDKFLELGKFHMTGKNANILSSSKDMAIRLDKDVIKSAEEEFRVTKIRDILKIEPRLTAEQANSRIRTIPERVYRERMNETEAILVIYLFDSYYSFNQHPSRGVEEKFTKYVNDNGINLEIPLVGYAIGFPPIENDPGGVYLKGNFEIEEDEFTEEFDELDIALPDDLEEMK